jgi:hypothetical protein
MTGRMCMKKVNCWDFKRCGREIGGSKSRELGVCPSAMESRLNGAHGGLHAGRACWVVAGTLCGGTEQGSFAQKFHNCEKCDFYQAVRKEEAGKFVYSSVLLSKMRQAQNAVS